MAYIVPSELPKTCSECPFCNCKFSHPFWSTDMGDLCGKQGFYCILDTQNPRRIMVVDFGDKTKKMDWCPLKEVVRCEDCKHSSGTRMKPNTCVCFKNGVIMFADDFCSYGKRRSDDVR